MNQVPRPFTWNRERYGLHETTSPVVESIGKADRIERVSTEEALGMAFRLAREEGLFAGTSTGANVVAALRLAEQLGSGATIVTVMCDTGMKYLRTYGAKIGES